MTTVRSFIALELPAQVKAEIARLQADLKASAQARRLPLGGALKWVAPEAAHLTLRFLGSVQEESIADIKDVLEACSPGLSAFALQVTELGAFPHARRPRVIWLGLGGDLGPVADLQRQVEAAIVKLGFPPEQRGFSPHLTIARVRERASPQEFSAVAQMLSSPPAVTTVPFVANHLSLMRSDLRPTGAIYQPLRTIALPS